MPYRKPEEERAKVAATQAREAEERALIRAELEQLDDADAVRAMRRGTGVLALRAASLLAVGAMGPFVGAMTGGVLGAVLDASSRGAIAGAMIGVFVGLVVGPTLALVLYLRMQRAERVAAAELPQAR